AIGNNGFLVLLQKTNSYAVNTNAGSLKNTGSQSGWGDNCGSSIGHNGRNSGINLVNASVTYLLISSPVAPLTSDNVDTNGDGWMDGVSSNWTILDSVGILDGTSGIIDYSFGKITFKNSGGI